MKMKKSTDLVGELLTVPQTCESSNLGRDTVMRIAKEANAIIRIGRSVRIMRNKFFSYIEEAYSA